MGRFGNNFAQNYSPWTTFYKDCFNKFDSLKRSESVFPMHIHLFTCIEKKKSFCQKLLGQFGN